MKLTDEDRVPRRRWTTRMRNFRGSLLIASPDGSTELELTDAGSFIFRAMDGVRTVREIATALAGEYTIPLPAATADVTRFAVELAEMKFIDLVDK